MVDTVLSNLTVLAIIIIAVWLATMAYYYYASRQQREIQEELDALRAQLQEMEEQAE